MFRLRSSILGFLLLTLPVASCFPASVPNRESHRLPPPVVSEGWGVNIHFIDPKPGEMEQIAGAGFRWARMDFSWSGIEKAKGVYDFTAYDGLLTALKLNRVRPYFILDYGNELYQEGSPRSPEAVAAFARFAAAAVKHFRGQGVLWEMFNEPNGGFWKPAANVEEYIVLAKATGAAIRLAAPQEWYIGPATSGVDFAFLEKCFQAGLLEVWDAVSVHPYRNTPPETSTEDIRKLRGMIGKYAPKGKRIPIISGEWGYSELYPGLNLEKQSQYIARQYLTNLMNGVVLSIWYDWHDDGEDPKEAEHHFGTVYPDYKSKPTYSAAQTLAHTLKGYRYNKRIALDSPDDYCLVFSNGKKAALAVWTTDSTAHMTRVPASPGEFRVVGLTGATSTADADEKGLRIALAPSPSYYLPVKENRLLEIAAGWSALPAVVTAGKASDLRDSIRPLVEGKWPHGVRPDSAEISLENAPFSESADMGPGGKMIGSLKLGSISDAMIDDLMVDDRNDRPRRLRAILDVSGQKIVQDALLYPRHPLRLVPTAPTKGGLLFRIENPTGAAFEGILYNPASSDSKPSVPVVFLPGETEKEVVFPLTSTRMPEEWTVQAALAEETTPTPQPVAGMPGLRIRALPLPGTDDGTCEVTPDGDPKVKSTLSCEIGAPPDGLPVAMERAVKIGYAFDKGWKFLRLPAEGQYRDLQEEDVTALGAWIYGDGSGDLLRMRFTDDSGQTFQPDGGPLDWKGWRYVTFPLTGEKAGYWGGANDGKVHAPLHFDTLLLVDSPGGRGGTGTISATGFTLMKTLNPSQP